MPLFLFVIRSSPHSYIFCLLFPASYLTYKYSHLPPPPTKFVLPCILFPPVCSSLPSTPNSVLPSYSHPFVLLCLLLQSLFFPAFYSHLFVLLCLLLQSLFFPAPNKSCLFFSAFYSKVCSSLHLTLTVCSLLLSTPKSALPCIQLHLLVRTSLLPTSKFVLPCNQLILFVHLCLLLQSLFFPAPNTTC